jgi:hypothetical protein
MDFSLSNIKDVVTIITSLVLPAILYVLSQIRGHLRRIEKIEKDVNVAHKRIRKLAANRISFDDDDESEGDLCEQCPLAKADE